METCVVVAQQRTQYSSRGKSHALGRYGGLPSSSCFKEINCGSFQSGAGLIPTPLKKTCSGSRSSSTSIAKSLSSSDAKPQRAIPKCTPISIKTEGYKKGLCFHESSYSELWAGPAYSHSPPPSSVPIPRFSTRSKPTRTVSLELPVIAKEVIQLHPLAKSAPSSPRRSHYSAMYLYGTADNATAALRRILNLDICDE